MDNDEVMKECPIKFESYWDYTNTENEYYWSNGYRDTTEDSWSNGYRDTTEIDHFEQINNRFMQ